MIVCEEDASIDSTITLDSDQLLTHFVVGYESTREDTKVGEYSHRRNL